MPVTSGAAPASVAVPGSSAVPGATPTAGPSLAASSAAAPATPAKMSPQQLLQAIQDAVALHRTGALTATEFADLKGKLISG